MRKAAVLLVSAATAVSLAGTSSPARAASAPKFVFSTTGVSAEALFSDLPDSGPVPRTTYHDTYVVGGQSLTKADGTVSSGAFAFYDQLTYSFDRRGNFVFISEAFGYGDGSAVAFTGDKHLTSASVSATVPQTTCDASYTCTDGGSQTFNVSWTGVGDVSHIVGSFQVHNRTLHYTSHFNGYNRNATATGLGTAVFADMNSGKETDRCVGAGC